MNRVDTAVVALVTAKIEQGDYAAAKLPTLTAEDAHVARNLAHAIINNGNGTYSADSARIARVRLGLVRIVGRKLASDIDAATQARKARLADAGRES